MDLEENIIHADITSDYRNRHAQIYSSVDRQLIEIRWYRVRDTILPELTL